MSGPISNLNSNAYNAIQNLNGGQLDATKATQLRRAIMADNVVDKQEAELVNTFISGKTSAEVVGRESADFEPLNVSFAEVTQEAKGELNDVLAMYDLQERGFVHTNDSGKRSYNPDALRGASANELNQIIGQLNDNGGDHGAPLFYLKVAGANLDNASERNSFIKEQISNPNEFRRDVTNLHNILKRAPGNPHVSSALNNITSAIRDSNNVEAAYQFLQDIDFTNVEMNNPQGTSGDVDDMWFNSDALIGRDGASALPAEAADNLAAVLDNGRGMARRAATHLRFHLEKLGAS